MPKAPSVNRSYDVPYLAGTSKDGSTVYIDRHLPRQIDVGGKKFDPASSLGVHELTEYRAMEGAGMKWEPAHKRLANVAERKWLQGRGIDWRRYEEIMDGYLSHMEGEKLDNPPPDLYIKPYPANMRHKLVTHGVAKADGGAADDTANKALDLTPHQSDVISLARETLSQRPVQRRQFSIASQAEPISDIPTDMPRSDVSNPSTMSLATAFDKAIEHHLSLSRGDRILNSKEAIKRLAPLVGMRKDGTLVPLLGKNEKLLKTEIGYKGEKPVTWHDGRGIEAAGLALSPSFELNNFSTCPNSASCKDECLGKTSGNYFKVGGGRDLSEFKGPRLNSLNKTLSMLKEPEAFATRLYDEIAAKKREAEMNGNILGVRLNVLSDINPRVHQAIIKAFPDIAFYDYTKMAYRPIADNHHYTYSSTGVSQPDVVNPNSNWKRMRRMLDTGENVAMAFTDTEHLPKSVFDEETGKRYNVVNGDTHDFRPLDRVPDGQDGVIVGLKNKKGFGSKSDAHKESKGFFVKYDPGRIITEKGTYDREPSTELGPSGKPKLGTTKITNDEVRIIPQTKHQIPMTNDGKKEREL